MNQNYIKHIDGLRALAIFGVIIYHAKIYLGAEPFLKGGYLGVDLFFVISGYLMTLIISDQCQIGNFNFKDFLLRRLRRIFPALLFICIISLPIMYFLIMPADLSEQIKSIVSSIFFFSNFFYSVISQEYAAETTLIKPFIHTWSLSVEMQFYFILPFIILFSFRKKMNLLGVFIILIITFFLYSVLSNIYVQDLNFYNTISRLWEFLFGGLIYFVQKKNLKINQNDFFSIFLIIFSFVTIITYFYFFDSNKFFKTWTLLPFIISSGILIFFKDNYLLNYVCNLKLISFIGKISYSLYLVHFPIFAFSRITDFTKGNLDKKILIGLGILILSLILHKFIEVPFRDKRKINLKMLNKLCLPGIAFILFFYFHAINTNGLDYRTSNLIKNSHTEKTWLMLKDNKGINCYNRITHGQEKFCNFNVKSQKNVFLVGDSLAGSFSYNLKNQLVKNNYNFTSIASGGCVYMPNFNIVNSKNNKIIKHCNSDYQKKIRDLLLSSPKSTIILSGEYPIYIDGKFYNNSEGNFRREKYHLYFQSEDNKTTFEENFINSTNELLNYGHNVILHYPFPQLGWDPKRKIFYNNVFSKEIDLSIASIDYGSFKNYTKNTRKLFNRLKHENLITVFPEKLFCNSYLTSRCVAHNGKEFFYFDDHHLSYEGSKLINNQILENIKKIK